MTEFEQRVAALLREAKTIALIGASPDRLRPSNFILRYLLGAGYDVIPVNGNYEEIEGVKCVGDLSSIEKPIDIVAIFRSADKVEAHVGEAVKAGARAVWMPLGVLNLNAERIALDAGLECIMDRCMKVDHLRLVAKI
ncbi:MAG: CoA-binding protein [Planctomycetota bacterium]|jgi:predicted CoA-binding protein